MGTIEKIDSLKKFLVIEINKKNNELKKSLNCKHLIEEKEKQIKEFELLLAKVVDLL